MPSHLADRIRLERQRRFVGRIPEKTLFLETISAPYLPFYVLFVYGPGGIGKTQLFKEFIEICRNASAIPIYIDGRNIEPSPKIFLECICEAFGLPIEESPTNYLSSATQRYVLFIDTFELLNPLDQWLRETFLPQLSEKGDHYENTFSSCINVSAT
jgi:Cdc6-like AAA superfamily ATPase